MKTLKTAPQILEHYVPLDKFSCRWASKEILKAMRAYAKYKVDSQYEKLYQEAKRNVLKQYK